MKQGIRPFIEFYSNFIRIKVIFKKSSNDLLNELSKKLTKWLKNFYYNKGNYNNLREVKKYLLKLDNY